MQKNKFYIFFTLCLGLILILNSCYHDKEDLLYGSIPCETLDTSFSADILPIINNSCATVGCHVQGGSGIGLFENYLQVKAKVDDGSFNSRVLIQKNMPPDGLLSDCQLLHIQEWILNGAPNN